MIRAGLTLASVLIALDGWTTPVAVAAPGTEVRTVVAVDNHGQPINGYRIGPEVGEVDDCTQPSPSAVGDNIYFCYPYVAGAHTCWPSPPEALLCVVDPAEKELRRVTHTGTLTPVRPQPTPQPLALVLDDGTQCQARYGGVWGVRADGYAAVYGCRADFNVLRKSDPNPPPAIDRSQPQWTVQVGPTNVGSSDDPPPQTRTVRTAWFAGNPGDSAR